MTSTTPFIKMDFAEFEVWLSAIKVRRYISSIQQHHTYLPNDGTIVTGRDLELTPACIYGANSHSICIENVGDFDKDNMTEAQRNTIVKMTALLCKKFNLPITTNSIVYHHWYDLGTGERNNGVRNNKSCPGTKFFGGNKVADCEKHFLPLVKAQLAKLPIQSKTVIPQKYVIVNVDSLNVREGAGTNHAIVKTSYQEKSYNSTVGLGSVLRVFDEKDNWYKISHSASHWVYGKMTTPVT